MPSEPPARLGPLAGPTRDALDDLVRRDAVARTFAGDHTLWRDDPTEVADRLGWIPVVAEVAGELEGLRARCDRLVGDVDHVLLMGMGGSSLFPEVLATTFPRPAGRPRLVVLDTTDPRAIARVAAECAPDRTLHVAASKSGSTLETRSHLEWAWWRAGGDGPFAVVTDPGSELGALAHDRGFLEVFENRPDIGGRYSALSLFGVVPGLLAGVDVAGLLAGGAEALDRCGPGVAPGDNPALQLAAAMAAGVRAGRDKLTVLVPDEVATFGLWLEQLVAESLGKDGTGVVPVVGEVPTRADAYGADRLFVVGSERAELADELVGAGHPVVVLDHRPDPRAVGRAVVTWELAVAWCGAALGLQPFDQPDVAAAKAATQAVLDGAAGPVPAPVPLAEALAVVRPGDHLALQAFVDPRSALADDLVAARLALRDRLGVAVSLGFGPRFLHSTGQLHKGGPEAVVCVQVVDELPGDDVAIPGAGRTFGQVERAQADGDLLALRARGRRAFRVGVEELAGAGG
ncbi:MAG: glucose-6-phosphate isomerase [Acidimicrobiia bacterium]